MLQQIIKDMYIEPDLLAELSDEQKQLIFMKIREEQVRRWQEQEDKLEKQMKDKLVIKNPNKSKSNRAGAVKTVEFLLGADQSPWVWVMGEHSEDKSIDEIIYKEVREEARKKAETEAEILRAQEEREAEEKLKQEQKRLEDEKLKQEQELAKAAAKRVEAEKLAKSKQEAVKAEKELKKLKPRPPLCKRHSSDGMALAAAAAKSTSSGDKPTYSPLTVDTSRNIDKVADAKTIIVEGEEFDLTSPKAKCDMQCSFCFEEKSEKARLSREESYRVLKEKRTTEILSQFQKTKLLWEKKAAEDGKQIQQAWEQQEKKSKQAETKLRRLVKASREDYRRNSVTQSQNVVQKRNPRMSREVFRESVVLLSNSVTATKQMSKSKVNRKARPQSKKEIEDWFLEEEKQRKVGLCKAGLVEPWFHGIISREDAEGLLESKPVHSYLVRVSEKIWGYAISYKAEDRCKHYLIDTTDNGYQFFGTNQLEHPSLLELLQHHKNHPVSTAGQELLMFPVGQGKGLPDYATLFPELVETTSL